MPNKSIYIKEEDMPVFDRAVEVFGSSLSAIIADSVKKRLQDAEASGELDMAHQSITVGTWGGNDLPNDEDNLRKVGFKGRLVGAFKESLDRGRQGTRRRIWKAYLTQKGKGLIWCKYETQWQGERDMADYMITDPASPDEYFTPKYLTDVIDPANESIDTTPLAGAPVPLAIQSALREAVIGDSEEFLDV